VNVFSDYGTNVPKCVFLSKNQPVLARPFQFDREVVLNNAMLLFWQRGYFNTSFEEIVDCLELSRSSIYNSFKDKRSLFVEALKHYIAQESTALVQHLHLLPPTPEGIRTLLDRVVEANLSGTRPRGCLVVNTAIEFAGHDSEIQEIITSNLTEVTAAFSAFIRVGQRKGNISKALGAEVLAVSLFHQITALRVTGKVLNDRTYFDSAIKAFVHPLKNT
jgi:TetR/AcrR family transcriptional regulator, transcriptional repressor for nem operon